MPVRGKSCLMFACWLGGVEVWWIGQSYLHKLWRRRFSSNSSATLAFFYNVRTCCRSSTCSFGNLENMVTSFEWTSGNINWTEDYMISSGRWNVQGAFFEPHGFQWIRNSSKWDTRAVLWQFFKAISAFQEPLLPITVHYRKYHSLTIRVETSVHVDNGIWIQNSYQKKKQ